MDKKKAQAKRAVNQHQRDYHKWKAELEEARIDCEACKAGARQAQEARAAWIGERLFTAAEQDPDGKRLRSLVSELQSIGDDQVMARLEAVAPHLEPWMRKAITIYAFWEREVQELTLEREMLGRRTLTEDAQARTQQYQLTEVGKPDDMHAYVLVDNVVRSKAGTTARMEILGTPVTAVTPIDRPFTPSRTGSKQDAHSPTRSRASMTGTPNSFAQSMDPEMAAMNEAYLSELTTKVTSRQGEMQTMRKNFSSILQHRLVHGIDGNKLTFDEAERLLAALSTKDYARKELKVLQHAVLAARPAEDARVTFKVSQEHLRSMRDPLGYLRQSKSISNPLTRSSSLPSPPPSRAGTPASPTRAGTPASPTRPKSTPHSPVKPRPLSVPGRVKL
jgi:hypothetical protein